jgi:NTE family protein
VNPAFTADALAELPVLAGLPDELRERIAADAREVRVEAGGWLFRAGDEALAAYVVLSGRLEVVAAGPPEVVLGVLTRGALFGELALLTDGARSASVRARRDSAVVELGRAQFELLIDSAPGFAARLARSLGAQVAARGQLAAAGSPPRAVAVIALDAGAPSDEVARLLARALPQYGKAAELRSDPGRSPADYRALLDRAAASHDRVVLAGGGAARGESWTDFCRQEADIVVAVTRGVPDRTWIESPAPLDGCELVVAGGAGIAEEIVEVIAPREVQVLRSTTELERGLAITARRLSGRAVGLVLSGGGARALAHVGVYDELHEAGLAIDRFGGTSMGAVISAIVASGATSRELHAMIHRGFIASNPSNDFTLPAYSLIRGRKTYQLLRSAFGDTRIEELPLRFFCVSCDLETRTSVVHRTGPLADAVYASLAIPGIFPPVADGRGRLLVDGGVLDNLPVEPMARTGEGPVIAADVSQRGSAVAVTARPRLSGLERRVRRALTGSELSVPRVTDTLMRSFTLNSSDTVASALRHADLVILPRVDGVGMLDWKRLPLACEIGRQAARAALEQASDRTAAWTRR